MTGRRNLRDYSYLKISVSPKDVQVLTDKDIRFIHLFTESLINKIPLTAFYKTYPLLGSSAGGKRATE